MAIAEGDRIPDIQVRITGDDGMPAASTTGELLGSGKVVLFAVPGAFTPGCSNTHMPGFVVKTDDILAKGVDKIACIAVNDAFVMKAWGESQDVLGAIEMIADPAGDFTKAVDLTMDGSKFGLGLRSQRYSMYVVDGVVQQLNVEAGGEFKVSAADYLLAQI